MNSWRELIEYSAKQSSCGRGKVLLYKPAAANAGKFSVDIIFLTDEAAHPDISVPVPV
jgi:hypothetical protein